MITYLSRWVPRSRLLARMIFHIDFRPVGMEDYYFDLTTVALVGKLKKVLPKESRVLDMGTGTAAVVGLTLWRRLRCHVVACDKNPEIVALAEESIRYNQAPIRVIQSNFFDNVDEEFDSVVFNPPYVPTSSGKEQKFSEMFRSQWDGGSEGLSVIEGFLDAFGKLKRPVMVYMGVNHLHVPKERVLALLKSCAGILIKEIYSHPILPVDIYIFQRKSE